MLESYVAAIYRGTVDSVAHVSADLHIIRRFKEPAMLWMPRVPFIAACVGVFEDE